MKTKLLVLFLCFFNCFILFSQTKKEYAVLFYNVENLFDCVNDSLTADDEFTPDGERHWTPWRLDKKCKNISKSILAAIGWNTPLLIGLCEVENRYVVEKLINNTPLRTFPLRIIHKESPDFRGIDVACLYNSDLFYPLVYRYYPIPDDDQVMQTREILHLSGIVNKKDTMHFFMNHWPSRYSGVLETKEAREKAAVVLKEKVTMLLDAHVGAKIVIMGDFNDQPSDDSILKYLNAEEPKENFEADKLYNLSYTRKKGTEGTLKYKSQWFVFDQVIVSGTLLKSGTGLSSSLDDASVFINNFLLEEDEKYGGKRPFRTYLGFKYKGGFSDHLPVKLVLTEQ